MSNAYKEQEDDAFEFAFNGLGLNLGPGFDKNLARSMWNAGFERGRQQGMAQEAALLELAKDSQDMGEYGTAQPSAPNVDALSNFIRQIDGDNSMGAGALAEAICGWIAQQEPKT